MLTHNSQSNTRKAETSNRTSLKWLERIETNYGRVGDIMHKVDTHHPHPRPTITEIESVNDSYSTYNRSVLTIL